MQFVSGKCVQIRCAYFFARLPLSRRDYFGLVVRTRLFFCVVVRTGCPCPCLYADSAAAVEAESL